MRTSWGVCIRVTMAWMAIGIVVSGCGGSDEDTPSISPLGNLPQSGGSTNAVAATPAPAGPNLAGSWSGLFLDATTGARESITATITQSGSEITIDTSLSGLGSYFTGSIQSDGFLWLTDASDGETWTTLSGAATARYLVIQDYVTDPDDPDELVLNTIELSR